MQSTTNVHYIHVFVFEVMITKKYESFGSFFSVMVHRKAIKKNTVILQVNKLDYYCQVELPLLNYTANN